MNEGRWYRSRDYTMPSPDLNMGRSDVESHSDHLLYNPPGRELLNKSP
jgi:hypothetical protein